MRMLNATRTIVAKTSSMTAILTLAACNAHGDKAVGPAASEPTPTTECAAYAGRRTHLVAHPGIARQGVTLELRAYVRDAPHLPPEYVPTSCLRDWRIVPAAAATVSADGSGLNIAADAPAGERLTVTAEAPGGFTYLETNIVGRDDIVLTGMWRQVEIECPSGDTPREPIRELEFTSLGGFSVTWLPFEVYKDYWGKARYDAGEGRLTLTVEGGNNVQGGLLLSGQARLDDDGRLTLNGVYLGDQRPVYPPSPCRYVFARN